MLVDIDFVICLVMYLRKLQNILQEIPKRSTLSDWINVTLNMHEWISSA